MPSDKQNLRLLSCKRPAVFQAVKAGAIGCCQYQPLAQHGKEAQHVRRILREQIEVKASTSCRAGKNKKEAVEKTNFLQNFLREKPGRVKIRITNKWRERWDSRGLQS